MPEDWVGCNAIQQELEEVRTIREHDMEVRSTLERLLSDKKHVAFVIEDDTVLQRHFTEPVHSPESMDDRSSQSFIRKKYSNSCEDPRSKQLERFLQLKRRFSLKKSERKLSEVNPISPTAPSATAFASAAAKTATASRTAAAADRKPRRSGRLFGGMFDALRVRKPTRDFMRDESDFPQSKSAYMHAQRRDVPRTFPQQTGPFLHAKGIAQPGLSRFGSHQPPRGDFKNFHAGNSYAQKDSMLRTSRFHRGRFFR